MSATATYLQRATLLHRLRQRVMDIEAPQTMDALTPAQFMAVAYARAMKDETQARAAIVWALLDLEHRDIRTNAGFKLLSRQERYQLGVLANPFMGECTMVGTPLRSFRVGWRTLRIVHQDLFRQVTAQEWGRADGYFLAYQRTGNLDELRAMAAVLYVYGNATVSERLNGNGHAPTLRLVNKLGEAELLGIAQMWSCQRRVYEKESHMPFSSGEKSAKSKPSPRAWSDAMLDMSGGKFGDHATVLKTPVRDLFRLMHREMWAERQRKLNPKNHAAR